MSDAATGSAKSKRRPPLSFLGLLDVAVVLGGGASLLGFLGSWWWFLDLMTHFRLQYAWLFGLGCLCYAALRRWRRLGGCAVLLTVQVLLIVPLYWGSPPASPASGTFRVMLINVYSGNPRPERVVELLQREQPDLVVLEEITSRWLPELEAWRESYSHTIERPEEDNFGIGLYSRFPIVEGGVVVIGEAGVASIEAVVEIEGQLVRVMATHPPPPVGGTYSSWRNGQMEELGQRLAGAEEPVLLVGDLNATSWSHSFKQLRKAADLRDSRQGFGVQSTWPTHMWWMRVPLDHVLVSDEVAVHQRVVGPSVGSDHLPVIVDFSLHSPRR